MEYHGDFGSTGVWRWSSRWGTMSGIPVCLSVHRIYIKYSVPIRPYLLPFLFHSLPIIPLPSISLPSHPPFYLTGHKCPTQSRLLDGSMYIAHPRPRARLLHIQSRRRIQIGHARISCMPPRYRKQQWKAHSTGNGGSSIKYVDFYGRWSSLF